MKLVNKPHMALKIDGFQANLVHEIDIKRTKGYNLPTHGGNGSGSRAGVTPPDTPKKQKAHHNGRVVPGRVYKTNMTDKTGISYILFYRPYFLTVRFSKKFFIKYLSCLS